MRTARSGGGLREIEHLAVPAPRRPTGTRRAQVIAIPSERRLSQGREAAQRTLDTVEHRGILENWARRAVQCYAGLTRSPTAGNAAHKFRRLTGARSLDNFRNRSTSASRWDRRSVLGRRLFAKSFIHLHSSLASAKVRRRGQARSCGQFPGKLLGPPFSVRLGRDPAPVNEEDAGLTRRLRSPGRRVRRREGRSRGRRTG